MKFEEFGLHPDLLEALGYMNYEKATPIQEAAIPAILAGKDIIGCAQTGTGKTAAFVLPMLNRLLADESKGTRALIICPTRELAIQIDQLIEGLVYFSDLSSFAVYGGGTGPEWENERRAFSQGVDIIIATPGRLKSHMANGYVNFSGLQFLVLDEADRMLDIGFYDDIIRIIKALPTKRQSLMFSATMAPKIRKLAREILSEPEEFNFSLSKPAEGVNQQVYLVHDEQKDRLVRKILRDHPEFKSILVFSSTKRKVNQLVRKLKERNFNVAGISSDYDQEQRKAVLLDFKSRNTRIVVATDVLSRGIDIKDIDLVINYDVPQDAEDYVHRVGRTARAATKGMAITFVNPVEMGRFDRIEKLIERRLEKQAPPEEMGPGPEWQVDKRSGRSGGRPRPKGAGKGRPGSAKKGFRGRAKGKTDSGSKSSDQ